MCDDEKCAFRWKIFTAFNKKKVRRSSHHLKMLINDEGTS